MAESTSYNLHRIYYTTHNDCKVTFLYKHLLPARKHKSDVPKRRNGNQHSIFTSLQENHKIYINPFADKGHLFNYDKYHTKLTISVNYHNIVIKS